MLKPISQLHEYLTLASQVYPHKTALVCDDIRLSYEEIHLMTNKMAHYLRHHGLKRGDRVVVCLGNSVETVIAFWGVLKAGGVIVIISDDLKLEKIDFILKDSGCQFFMAKSSHIDYSSFKYVNKIIDIENDFAEIMNFEISDNIPSVNLDLDLASIIYTSGSTGEPKGVMLTHRNMLAALQSINIYLGNHAGEVILSALPLSFDYGLYQMMMAFSVGGRLILEKNLLLPLRFIRKISDEQVTAVPGVPTLFALLSETFKKFKFNTDTVRYVTNTGAAIYEQHIDAIQAMFPNANFFSMYGLTECKRCTYLPPKDLFRKRGSVGIPIPNTEIWIVNENDEKVPPNIIGQLVIRGATVMKGYWNRPEETAKKLKKDKLSSEPVLYTGDYGFLDEEGYFYFKGRMDEEIKSRGVKVSPKEIEEIIYSYQGIKEVAVVGVYDNFLGNKIIAYVVGLQEFALNSEDLYQFCKQKMEKEKIPHQIVILNHLPKTTNGKINKKLLQEGVYA